MSCSSIRGRKLGALRRKFSRCSVPKLTFGRKKCFGTTLRKIVGESEIGILRAMHRLVMRSRAHLLEPFQCLALVARLNVPTEIVTFGLGTVVHMVLGERAKLFVNIRGRELDTKDALLRTVSAKAVFITDTVVDIARCHEQYGNRNCCRLGLRLNCGAQKCWSGLSC